MRLPGLFAVLSVVFAVGPVFGTVSMDPLWIFKDLPDTDRLYNNFQLYDTCRSMSLNQIYPTDTGSYDSSHINFNYQFSTDTMRVIDLFDPSIVIYKDYRPGYAGFKIDWDGGLTGFPLGKYKFLSIAHKGPLSGHKVTIRFGYNYGCGSPTTFETIGTFSSSTEWKTDDIAIPERIRNIPDSENDYRSYYEMQVLVTNADPLDTNRSSPEGILKIDNIALRGASISTTSAFSNTLHAPHNEFTLIFQNNAFSMNIPKYFTGPTEMTVYSISGKVCAHLFFAGNGLIKIPAIGLPRNLYTVVFKNRAGIVSRKIFVQ